MTRRERLGVWLFFTPPAAIILYSLSQIFERNPMFGIVLVVIAIIMGIGVYLFVTTGGKK